MSNCSFTILQKRSSEESCSPLSHCVILSTPQSLTSHRADTFCLPLSFVSIGRSSAYCHPKLLLYLRSVWAEDLSQSRRRDFQQQQQQQRRGADPTSGAAVLSASSLGLDVRETGVLERWGPDTLMGPREPGRSSPFFRHSRLSTAMPQCWCYLCWCCWACWIPLVPGPAAPLGRLATPGREGTPGAAEECTNTLEERRDAGSSTALLNTIYKSTLTGK